MKREGEEERGRKRKGREKRRRLREGNNIFHHFSPFQSFSKNRSFLTKKEKKKGKKRERGEREERKRTPLNMAWISFSFRKKGKGGKTDTKDHARLPARLLPQDSESPRFAQHGWAYFPLEKKKKEEGKGEGRRRNPVLWQHCCHAGVRRAAPCRLTRLEEKEKKGEKKEREKEGGGGGGGGGPHP